VRLGPCRQDIAAFPGKRRKDRYYLLDGFAGTVNNLRQTAAKPAMMVNAGEFQIFIGQMLQIFNRLVDGNIAAFDFFQ